MACPYFYPVAKAEVAMEPARSPLGAMYRGKCDLGGAADSGVVESDACNFGYAEGRCNVFPLGAEVDAVRFTVLEGRVVYVLEKNHSPVRHGEASLLDSRQAIGRQAEVFASWIQQS